MNTNKTVADMYPSVIVTFAETQIEVWFRASADKQSVVIMGMKPVDQNTPKEDWDWIEEIKHIEQIERLVVEEMAVVENF